MTDFLVLAVTVVAAVLLMVMAAVCVGALL